MATTIKLKNGSGAPSASDLVQGEPALDLTNNRLYSENGSGSVVEIGTNPTSLSINGTAITATAAELNILDGVTSTAAELNILDGVTSTTAELNILDGVTATTAELNILDGVTATAAELNIMDGVTSTTAELNILDGVTSTAAELNILDGVTSTAAELNILDGVTSTTAELNILDGVTSTTAELNILDGVTATAAELNVLDGVTAFVDEDDMSSDSATSIPSQQSVKAYVDSQVASADTLSELTDTNITSPADGALLFYDTGTSKWIDNVVSGDVTIADTGVAAIGSGVIVNDDINASAAISVSKTALTAGTGLTLTTNTLSVDASQTQITAVGTIGTGTWQGTAIADAYVADNLTISGGTVDNTVIGGTTAAAGTFTTFTSTGIDDNATSTAITIDSSENVGIGTTSPTSTASAGPTLEISGTAGGNLVLSDSNATTGQRAKYLLSQGGALYVGHSADNGTSPVNDLVIDSSGNVGIGTAAPDSLLHVGTGDNLDGTDVSITLGGDTVNTRQALITKKIQSSDRALELYAASGGSSEDIRFFRDNTNETMRIDSSGNVGIGTTSPGVTLDVFDTSAAGDNTVARFRYNSSTTAETGGRLQFTNASGTELGYIKSNVESGTAVGLTFGTFSSSATAERMRIDSSGQVGIGTSSPSHKLHVEGSVSGDWVSQIYNTHASNGFGLKIRAGDDANVTAFYVADVSNTGLFSILGSGDVGIGTTSPANNLHIHTDAGDEGILIKSTGNTSNAIISDANRSSAGAAINNFQGKWNGTAVADMLFLTGADTTNKDDGVITFRTSSANNIAERMRILSSGGITFNGDTAAANALDDYEEGTWTPTISAGTASFSNAMYTKVGRIVTATVFFQSVSDQSSSTALAISGLPYASNANTFNASVGLSRYFNRGTGTIVSYIGGSANTIYFYALVAGGDYLSVRHSDLNNSSANYYVSVTYQAT